MGNHVRSRAVSGSLAAAAATAALSDAAHATTLNESTDFGDLFATRTLLPIGTDVVNGSVFPFEGDSGDVVTFQGLAPGQPFSLSTSSIVSNVGDVFQLFQLDDLGGVVQDDSGPGAALAGTIPASGNLHFDMTVEGGLYPGVNYSLTLTAPLPEPAGAALLGGGLLAAAALRRLRARHGS
jgi:hypothetical protein